MKIKNVTIEYHVAVVIIFWIGYSTSMAGVTAHLGGATESGLIAMQIAMTYMLAALVMSIPKLGRHWYEYVNWEIENFRRFIKNPNEQKSAHKGHSGSLPQRATIGSRA